MEQLSQLTLPPKHSSLGAAKFMVTAGTSQLTREGRNRTKKAKKSAGPWAVMTFFCLTIVVVMTPKGAAVSVPARVDQYTDTFVTVFYLIVTPVTSIL